MIPHVMEQLILCATAVEACAPRAHGLQQETPVCRNYRKSTHSYEDPVQPKKKKKTSGRKQEKMFVTLVTQRFLSYYTKSMIYKRKHLIKLDYQKPQMVENIFTLHI